MRSHTTVVLPCDKFVAPRHVACDLYREWCSKCGFHEDVHTDGPLSDGFWDPRRDTPGMENHPLRAAYLKLADVAMDAPELARRVATER